jgi:hypothetical protein
MEPLERRRADTTARLRSHRMAKYLLISILVASIAIPMRFARSKSARGGLRRVVWAMTFYVFIWVGFCIYLFLRMGGGY